MENFLPFCLKTKQKKEGKKFVILLDGRAQSETSPSFSINGKLALILSSFSSFLRRINFRNYSSAFLSMPDAKQVSFVFLPWPNLVFRETTRDGRKANPPGTRLFSLHPVVSRGFSAGQVDLAPPSNRSTPPSLRGWRGIDDYDQ